MDGRMTKKHKLLTADC